MTDAIFACPTCGGCMDSCQAPHADYIVDMIEALREYEINFETISYFTALIIQVLQKFDIALLQKYPSFKA